MLWWWLANVIQVKFILNNLACLHQEVEIVKFTEIWQQLGNVKRIIKWVLWIVILFKKSDNKSTDIIGGKWEIAIIVLVFANSDLFISLLGKHLIALLIKLHIPMIPQQEVLIEKYRTTLSGLHAFLLQVLTFFIILDQSFGLVCKFYKQVLFGIGQQLHNIFFLRQFLLFAFD